MFFSNYHSHSRFCDGRSSMETFVRFALSKGLRKYGFSSHAPLPFHTSWNMVEEDYGDYEKEFYRLKKKYNANIELYLGLEVDYIYNCSDITDSFFQNINLDYAIGSIHYLDKLRGNQYMTIDGPLSDFDRSMNLLYGGDIKKTVLRFYEISQMMVELGGFDIVGHVDKIILHALHYPEFNIRADWYVEVFKHLLLSIKRKGMMVEINTKSLLDRGITYPHQSFYEMIYDLDIPIMINSDCHYPDKVTNGFLQTYSLLYAIGFRGLQELTKDGWKSFPMAHPQTFNTGQ